MKTVAQSLLEKETRKYNFFFARKIREIPYVSRLLPLHQSIMMKRQQPRNVWYFTYFTQKKYVLVSNSFSVNSPHRPHLPLDNYCTIPCDHEDECKGGRVVEKRLLFLLTAFAHMKNIFYTVAQHNNHSKIWLVAHEEPI